LQTLTWPISLEQAFAERRADPSSFPARPVSIQPPEWVSLERIEGLGGKAEPF